MLVYVTTEAEKNAKASGLREQLDKAVKAIERPHAQISDRFKPLSHQGYWKKRVAPAHRLIAKVCLVDREPIACFLDVLPRDVAYDEFPSGIESLVPAERDLRKWVQDQIAKGQSAATDKLPDHLQPWLTPPTWTLEDFASDVVVYETEDWVKKFRNSRIQSYWQTFLELVTKASQSSKIGFDRCAAQDCQIIFSRILTSDNPSRNILLLIGANKGTENELQVPSTLEKVLMKDLRVDDLIGFVSRCYPSYLLADPETWRQIEFNDEANLALSAEEELMLKTVSDPVSSSSLPVFINGRAGSGKSTMLGYLFADYCERYLKGDSVGDKHLRPVFFAYNERLLDVAQKSVTALLSSHHRFLRDTTLDVTPSSLKGCFLPFQKYILSKIPEQERWRFGAEKYISFFQFKRLYSNEVGADQTLTLKLPSASDYSPEYCWYVIRTFIKGYSDDELLTPEDYKTLPRKDRTIPADKYSSLFTSIWSHWYLGLSEKGYWDDQDLVRYALVNEHITPEFAAVFCDEAQDFTRVELKLLMKLSVLSSYALEGLNVTSLPFAFAGDPFQTLNPTGFRCSSLKGTFHDEIIKAMDPAGQHGIEMTVFELMCNYRSDAGIVKASNLIQLWRRFLFDLELQPQRWLEKGEAPEPSKFVVGRNITVSEVKALVGNLNIITILPCEEEQILSFLQKDDCLGEMFKASTEVPANIFSVIGSKGLEFPRVVLYKFGNATTFPLTKAERGTEPDIEHEYYFNKLYVAATRPKNSLFIVDTEVGDAKLWSFANSREHVEEILSNFEESERQSWRDHISTISDAAPDSAADLKQENREEIADELYAKGRLQQSPSLLRRARKFYSSLDLRRQTDLCEASALQCEQDYKAAGDLFRICEEWKLSSDCYWAGECWPELLRSCDQVGERGMRWQVAKFMASSEVPVMLDFANWLEQNLGDESAKISGKQFVSAIATLGLRLSRLTSGDLSSAQWADISGLLLLLDGRGKRVDPETIGMSLYRANDFSRAIPWLEKAAKTQSPEYLQAQVAMSSGVKRLEWLLRAKNYREILKQKDLFDSFPTSEKRSAHRIYAEACESEGEHWEAFNTYLELGSSERAGRCLDQVLASSSPAKQSQALTAVFDGFIKRMEWAEGLTLAVKHLDPTSRTIDDNLRNRILVSLSRGYASSSLGPESLGGQSTKVSKLLRQLVDSPTWKSDITPKELGAALERIGNLVDVLRFYELLESESDTDVQKFAVYRWLTTKRKQEKLYRERSSSGLAQKAAREYANKLHDWESRRSDIKRVEVEKEPVYPIIAFGTGSQQVQGLPLTVLVEDLGTGIRFKLGAVELKTNWSGSRLLMTHDNLSNVSINLLAHKVFSEDIEISSALDSGVFSFSVPEFDCSGEVATLERALRVSLRFATLGGPILLDFPLTRAAAVPNPPFVDSKNVK